MIIFVYIIIISMFIGGSFWAIISVDVLEPITDYKGIFSALEIRKLEIVQ